MKITTKQLRKIIRESLYDREYGDPEEDETGWRREETHSAKFEEILTNMELSESEKAEVREALQFEGWMQDGRDWMDTTSWEKAYEYFTWVAQEKGHSGVPQMPYGTVKARSGDPVDWIMTYLESI